MVYIFVYVTSLHTYDSDVYVILTRVHLLAQSVTALHKGPVINCSSRWALSFIVHLFAECIIKNKPCGNKRNCQAGDRCDVIRVKVHERAPVECIRNSISQVIPHALVCAQSIILFVTVKPRGTCQYLCL